MGIWGDHVLPRIVNKACARADFAEPRHRTLAGVHGDVIEIGFGSGLNLAHYPASVGRIMAVEPSVIARRLAADRIAASAIPIEFVALDGQTLPLPDDCADVAVTTFTLCTIPDVDRALRELGRVLRPGGELRFLEHGLSPDPKVAAWQHRLTPIQKRVFGGCHFDRPITDLIVGAGYQLVESTNFYLPGPKTPSYMYQGIARPS
jgi:ubiquinone/menaquinone biosynthesis C-methylase UbiE